MADVSVIEEKITVESEKDMSEINEDEVHELMKDLSKFKVEKVLRNNSIQKLVAVVGTFEKCDGNALVILEKKIFPDEALTLSQGFFNETTEVNKIYQNDIYRGYDVFPTNKFNGLNATIIYPATPKHIEKYMPPEFYIVEESPELYKNVTLPKLLSQQFSLKWVDNILNGTAEADRVIFNDPDEETGFVLVKDSKWNDGLSILHLIALTRKPIMSIRDLNKDHLPLLRNIKEAGTKAIVEKYNLPANQIRIFFHYQPSYYHLHVHFTSTTLENAGTNCERAHMITSVISNIELMSDYYQKATLVFRVCKLSLYEPYEEYLKQNDDGPPAKQSRRSI
ncbi:hypothetical protein PV325_008325 [Microctonus aethiopoides]|uniref:m7GpppX diphosphatase n=1 Tax=Microctonus aethiopoides TaxID=144406 RepID=A0AA39FN86_9HYME|nr:hypothetical protein PV325_008325 [Microctonus aethiopoides]KAK0097374.1 hypothetical protein PV326_002239 [Microctonus aethiopoides]KAK0172653.1 hypothetical protein PV328_005948 [Microctonus aethiopoides]